jgi:hypothetical protein
MGRTELFEIHDHPWFPAFLRDLVTDALQTLWNFQQSVQAYSATPAGCTKQDGNEGDSDQPNADKVRVARYTPTTRIFGSFAAANEHIGG